MATAMAPNWFDKKCGDIAGKPASEVALSVGAMLGQAPEIIAAIQSAIEQNNENKKAGKMAATLTQLVRQRIAAALNS